MQVAESVLKESEARLRFLAELNGELQALSELEEIAAKATEIVGRHLRVERCAYAEVEPDEDHFVIIGDYTNGLQSIVGRHSLASFGRSCLEEHRKGRCYVVNNVRTDQGMTEEERAAYEATAIESVISVPLHLEGRFLGGMAVHRGSPYEWSEREIELIKIAAVRCWESMHRARATRDLKESEERLRSAQEGSGAGVWDWNISTRKVFWSREYYQIYGLEPGVDLPSYARWIDRIREEDCPAAEKALADSLVPDSRFYIEFRIHHPSRGERWIMATGRTLGDSEGKAVRFSGVARDITDRKKVEKALEYQSGNEWV